MEDPTTLNLEASVDVALKDTQEDEYYTNVKPEALVKNLKVLKQNPYPGLRPFKTSEANVFFGRKEITFELISRLATRRFLAVLGASGSGKSSLVRAGLFPGLKALPGKHGLWKIAICRSGKNPFGNLAVSISHACIAPSYTELDIWRAISSSSYGFEEMYNALNTSKEYNTLVVIDQFEELFRFKKDNGTTGKNEAALFVKMLIDISKIENLNTYVMITMRSEYLGDCVQFPDLVDEINSGQFLVPRLKFKQLKDVIIEPSGFSNTSVETTFAERLIGEIGDNMDQLPVLQHSLRRAYEEAKTHRSERGAIRVTYADYDRIGRMENALDKHAEEIFAVFDEKQRKYCQVLFQCITDKASDGRGIRRPLSLGAIHRICIELKISEDEDCKILNDLTLVVESYRIDNVNFLMPPENVPLNTNTEIDISHESLMRTWKRLMEWIDRESKDADLLRLLLNRDDSDYIRGSRLLTYREWIATKRNALTWANIYRPGAIPVEDYAVKFRAKILLVEQSIANEKEEQRQKELAKQREQEEKEQKAAEEQRVRELAREQELEEQQRLLKEQKAKARRRLIYIVFIFALFSIAAVATVVLLNINKKLTMATKTARSKTDSLFVANDQLTRKNDTIYQTVAALKASKLVLDSQVKQLTEKELGLKNKNERIAKDSSLLSAKNIELNTRIEQLRMAQNVSDTLTRSLQATNSNLVTTTEKAQNLQNLALAVKQAEKSLTIPTYDTKRQNIKAKLALVSYKLLQEAGKEEQENIQPQIYSGLYNSIRGFDIPDNHVWPVTGYRHKTDRLSVATSAKNKNGEAVVYLTAEDANLYAFNLRTKKTVTALVSRNKNLVSIEKSPDGRWIVINTLSGQLLLTDLQQAGKQDTSISFSGIVRIARFSPDGSFLYVYTKDDSLHRIQMDNIKNPLAYARQKLPYKLEDLAISNNFIYAVTSDGRVAKWNRSSINFKDPVFITVPKNKIGEKSRGTKIACNAPDSLIVWGNENGEVFYCYPQHSGTGQNLTRFGGPVTDIAFNEAGSYLAVSSYDRSVRVFQLSHLQAEAPIDLPGNEGPVTSVFFQKDSDHPGSENLVAIISPGIIRLFPMDMARLACELEHLTSGDLSAEEQALYFDKRVQSKINEKACTQ